MLLVLLLLTHVIRTCSSLECPQFPTSSDGIVLHNGRCCVVVTCKAGYKPRVCEEGKPETTECIPCPDGEFMANSYQSYLMKSCSRFNPCQEPGQKIVSYGNRTHDFKCACNREEGYVEGSNYPENCTNVCPAGQQMNSSGMCNPCKDRYFKPGGMRRCRPCSRCENASLSVLSACNTSHDSICESVDADEDVIRKNHRSNEYLFILFLLLLLVIITGIGVAVYRKVKNRRQRIRSKHSDITRPNDKIVSLLSRRNEADGKSFSSSTEVDAGEHERSIEEQDKCIDRDMNANI